MGQKSRPQRPARSSSEPVPGTGAPRVASAAPPALAQLKRARLVRFFAVVMVPALVFALAEAALRVGGYGFPTSFFEDTGDGKTLTTNQKFGWQYYSRARAMPPTPLLFPKEKAPGTARIFILGESAAAGTPDPAFGFARQLELMLREQHPGNRFEVINAAMRGIDSHIIRQIAAECAALSPDLFVVYAGNNEMIGLHAPSPVEFQLSAHVHWIRFQHAIKRTKLAQLGQSLVSRLGKGSKPAQEQDMEFFRRQRLALDDPKRDPVYRNFGLNLRDIGRCAEAAGAQTLICSVGVNLRDFPPLGSLHRRDLGAEPLKQWEEFYSAGRAAESRREFFAALTQFENAALLDGHFAELHFRMARSYEAVKKFEDARRHFALARDWDAIQFRTDSRLNSIARSVATNAGPGVRFVDVESRLAASPAVEHGLLNGKIFHEHVHLKFDGDYQLTLALLPDVARVLKLSPSTRSPLTRDECARRLACTPLDEANMQAAIARLTANPPFLDQLEHAARQSAADGEVRQRLGNVSREEINRTVAIYAQAIRARPEDWMLHHNLANLLTQAGQPRDAATEFAEVVKRLPGQRNFRVGYGHALLQSGQRAEAAAQFAAALKIDPEYAPAQQGLKAAGGGR